MEIKEKKLSIVMPVLNETWSLEQTVDVLMQENREAIKEIILVIHPKKTLATSLQSIEKVHKAYPEVISIHDQEKPYVGGAFQKGFELVTGEFTLMMACDLETDPRLVKEMLIKMQDPTIDVVAASRWLPGGSFSGYSFKKKLMNYVFQQIFSTLYLTHLTDMTYAFRMTKTSIIKSIKWTCLNHEIFFETLLKPLRLKCHIIEIPSQWTPRQEGESQIRMHYFIKYFYIGFMLRFLPVKRWLK